MNVCLPLGILSVLAVAEAAIGYAHSVDARGWWPIIFSVGLVLYSGYSLVFGAIAGERRLPAMYILGLNGGLAALKFLATYTFYALPLTGDAVAAGRSEFFLLQLGRSNWTYYLLPFPFLIVHFVATRIWWPDADRIEASSR
ncbi:hypothetical protein ACFPPF_11380 [Xenophilus aerolatus]|nr:hypothetical protein [Xenophilus aerolatus]